MFRFLILISCLFVVENNVYAQPNPCSEQQCMAVIDAGSTGSRMHVFAYELDDTHTPIHIKEIWSKKITPGFATIEANPNTVDKYLSNLLLQSPIKNIPVYFYATAGMRLLAQRKQKIYYQELQNWFSQHSEWQLMESKTITGSDEALYDWLAVNYHLDTLQAAPDHTIGVMDIGGASVQIVFPMQKNSETNKGSQIGLDLYGKHIDLFVHSFLGLGQNEMSHQLLDSPFCFANDYPLPNGESGQGNAVACAHEVSLLINRVHKVKNEVQAVLTANPVNSWYAIGGLTNLVESKPFQFQNNQITSQDLLLQADHRVCHQSWVTLSDQFPNDEYLEGYCLLPSFYYALMIEGYGLSPNQEVHYIPSDQNLDWTLGVVLHH